MNPTLATALLSAVVAVAGTVFTWMGRNRESSDKRIDTVISGHQSLLDDYRTDNEALKKRLDDLEASGARTTKELFALREQLAEQALEVFILRQRENDLRVWATDVMAWCAMAMGVIHAAGLNINEPPPIPKTYSTDV